MTMSGFVVAAVALVVTVTLMLVAQVVDRGVPTGGIQQALRPAAGEVR